MAELKAERTLALAHGRHRYAATLDTLIEATWQTHRQVSRIEATWQTHRQVSRIEAQWSRFEGGARYGD